MSEKMTSAQLLPPHQVAQVLAEVHANLHIGNGGWHYGLVERANRLRDEAARREAGETGECLAGKCHTSDTLGTCLPGACLFPDAPPPPAADLVARLNMLHAKHHFKPADEKTVREAAAAIEALRAREKALEGALRGLLDVWPGIALPVDHPINAAVMRAQQALAAGGADA